MTEQSKEAMTETAKNLREEVLTVLETLGNNLCDFTERAEALREENEALIREADENAALAMQHKMRADDLAKENAALKERLEKAVELPYKRKRLLWGDKDRETLLCPDCLTDLMGGIGDETFVVQCPNCGCFVNCMVEPIPFTEAAEARLAELEECCTDDDDR